MRNQSGSVLPFSKLNKTFFGYFDPENIFKILKINDFRGEITDISAKIEALERIDVAKAWAN